MLRRRNLIAAVLLAVLLVVALTVSPLYAHSRPNSDGVSYHLYRHSILLDWGKKPATGYAITIDNISRQGSALTVEYSLKSPSSGTTTDNRVVRIRATAKIPPGKERIRTVKLVRRTVPELPVVKDEADLKRLLAAMGARNDVRFLQDRVTGTGVAMKEAEKAESDYSRTNIQVEGVDEADTVKTDGNYIYQVTNNLIKIIKAVPAGEMRLAATIDCGTENTSPSEIYLAAQRLVVIGSGNMSYPVYPVVREGVKVAPPYLRPQGTTRVLVYDISNPSSPNLKYQTEISGNYLASRMIGTNLYLVANQAVFYDSVTPAPRPEYKDSASGTGNQVLPYSRIHYFPGSCRPNYLITAGIDINGNRKADIQAYLGGGEQVYVSRENLYVADVRYGHEVGILGGDKKESLLPEQNPGQETTSIYRFALSGNSVSFSAQGEVPGRVLNQFSMDEHDGYFRIATTSGDAWRTDQYASRNNVYVLDSGLKIKGKLEGLAPGEQIYSARFIGDRAYMVTFRTVDPLFVLNLKDPAQPEVLGSLKIPGYSNYLHPYDENHLIGFGKDTIELAQKDADGNVVGTGAFYMGMKMAMFDVSDVTSPKQESAVVIGDRGTDSELLYNHRVLLFSREKNLLAFPVTIMEAKGQEYENGFPSYGTFAFQGVLVYGINPDGGLVEKARVTHLSPEEMAKAGNYGADWGHTIQRVLYIGDTLYTLSPGMVKATSLGDFKDIGSLQI